VGACRARHRGAGRRAGLADRRPEEAADRVRPEARGHPVLQRDGEGRQGGGGGSGRGVRVHRPDHRGLTQGVDAISVAPNDPAAIGPILKKAKDRGVKVYTSDTDAPDSVRAVFVDQALAEDIGNTTMDELAKAMGGAGDYAIVSCGPTAQNLNTWIEIEKKRQAARYPRMKLVALKYAGEDVQEAIKVARDLITAFPTLKGLIGQCSTSGPGVAEAVTQMHKIGQIYATGISVPSLMRKYIKNGAAKSFVLWDPVKLGYLTVWAGRQLVEGKPFQPVNDVPTIGTVKYLAKDRILLLGPPTVFSSANVDRYDF
jgi:rhamnose transport system substrate-binding protein